jgi:alkyl sulfatase BDS1-like metallo-beta-lactamase superfamily hydrolase
MKQSTSDSGDERMRALETVERAAYGMYSVLCLKGVLTDDDPAVAAYVKASEALWADEIAEIDSTLS